MWAVLARDLADSVTLPLNISNLAKQLSREASQSLKYQEERVHRDVLRVNEVTFGKRYQYLCIAFVFFVCMQVVRPARPNLIATIDRFGFSLR